MLIFLFLFLQAAWIQKFYLSSSLYIASGKRRRPRKSVKDRFAQLLSHSSGHLISVAVFQCGSGSIHKCVDLEQVEMYVCISLS